MSAAGALSVWQDVAHDIGSGRMTPGVVRRASWRERQALQAAIATSTAEVEGVQLDDTVVFIFKNSNTSDGPHQMVPCRS